MKPIEKLTTKLAKQICKDLGKPIALWQLVLNEAYDLVYFGDRDELAVLVKRAKAEKEYEAAK